MIDSQLQYSDLPAHFNIASFFLDSNLEAGRGGRTALISSGRAISYESLARLTNQVGHALRGLGVGMEDRVLLALSDGIEFVASWFAVLKVGAVVAEVYTFLQPRDYGYYLNYSRAKLVIVDGTTLEAIRAVAPQCPHLNHVLVVGVDGDLQQGESRFEALVAEAPETLEVAPTTKDDIALWKFTTGSTGDPKAAVHCHHDPAISFAGYGRGVLHLTQDDIILPVPKLFFGYARDLTALFNFKVGARGIVFPERTTPEVIFEYIESHRPTILVNVPTMMNAMTNDPSAEDRDLSSLRLCISSGEALPLEIHRKWEDLFGVEVLEGIGSSEAYHIYISNRIGEGRPGSAGKVVPGYQARIVDRNGKPVPDGETGELWVSGDSSAILYWNDHEKSKYTFSGDWIRTGDMFLRDREGYFWYQGRADDLIKVGGIWVSPLEIESCLQTHAAVLACATIGVEEGGLMLPRAYVVLQGGAPSTDEMAEDLRRYVKQALAPHKYPREILFVSELPKTASGKIDRRALRQLTADGEAI